MHHVLQGTTQTLLLTILTHWIMGNRFSVVKREKRINLIYQGSRVLHMISSDKKRLHELLDFVEFNGKPWAQLYDKDRWYGSLREIRLLIKRL